MFEEGDIINKIILTSFVMPILLSILLIWFFISYQKKKTEYQLALKDEELKRQSLIIDKQNALQEERTRIAAEMHDDLGGGLTTIRFLSQKVMRKTRDDAVKTQVGKIVNQSETLVNNMSEIIWAMNGGFDTLASLISYTRRFAHEYLEEFDIHLSYAVEGDMQDIPLSGTSRRNIYLVIKEILHNAVKYAESNRITIQWQIAEVASVVIHDNGIGMTTINEFGNGLTNMQKRMEAIGGSMLVQNDKGLKTSMQFPIEV